MQPILQIIHFYLHFIQRLSEFFAKLLLEPKKKLGFFNVNKQFLLRSLEEMPKLVLNLYHSIEKISTLLLQVSCRWATDLKSDNFTIIVL